MFRCDFHVLVPDVLSCYRSCETLQLGQEHVSRQASQLHLNSGLAGNVKENSDNDTELLVLNR